MKIVTAIDSYERKSLLPAGIGGRRPKGSVGQTLRRGRKPARWRTAARERWRL